MPLNLSSKWRHLSNLLVYSAWWSKDLTNLKLCVCVHVHTHMCTCRVTYSMHKMLWYHFNCPFLWGLSVWQTNPEWVEGEWDDHWLRTRRAGSNSSPDSAGDACLLASTPIPNPLHLSHKALDSSISKLCVPWEIISNLFLLGFACTPRDYHLAESSLRLFCLIWCLIWSGFVTQALRPILALLGLWECQN